MKAQERKQARLLRREGRSLDVIARQVRCAKSTVSCWVRDIPLLPEQLHQLETNQARGRACAANHPNSPRQTWGRLRQVITAAAHQEVTDPYSPHVLRLIGAALYWAEGTKTHRSAVNFSNADPKMVRLMMVFFRDVCRVPEEKFRGVVHIHPHLDAVRARQYWSNVSGIPESQFHATQFGVSRASQQKRDTLPQGTFRIVVSDMRLRCRLEGWMQGLAEWGDPRANSSAG